MTKKDLSEYKQKYNAFRHHAWAGLGFLSVTLAFRLIFLESTVLLTPLIVILAIYILVAILFTYRYRGGLNTSDKIINITPSVEIENEKFKADVEKKRLKLEKKKAKSEIKKEKKSKK
jgi:hypothetical protein